jgi:hypothetical protein
MDEKTTTIKNTKNKAENKQKKEIKSNNQTKKIDNTKIMAKSISYYNLGNSIEETLKHINEKYKTKLEDSILQKWIDDFVKFCNNKRIRTTIVEKYNGNVINFHSFEHSGVIYNFKYHKPKMDMLCDDFPTLVSYLINLKKECPQDFFEDDGRDPNLTLDIKVSEQGKYNLACQLADFSLKHIAGKSDGHSVVEKFMLINDCSTIACEVPVWFWEKFLDVGISGHIDLLQIRRGCIYLLDYKPDAKRENRKTVASQLFLYASGLSFRTKIPLSKFRCAWFDQNNYYEFNPDEQNFSVKIKNKLYFRKL